MFILIFVILAGYNAFLADPTTRTRALSPVGVCCAESFICSLCPMDTTATLTIPTHILPAPTALPPPPATLSPPPAALPPPQAALSPSPALTPQASPFACPANPPPTCCCPPNNTTRSIQDYWWEVFIAAISGMAMVVMKVPVRAVQRKWSGGMSLEEEYRDLVKRVAVLGKDTYFIVVFSL